MFGLRNNKQCTCVTLTLGFYSAYTPRQHGVQYCARNKDAVTDHVFRPLLSPSKYSKASKASQHILAILSGLHICGKELDLGL